MTLVCTALSRKTAALKPIMEGDTSGIQLIGMFLQSVLYNCVFVHLEIHMLSIFFS